MKLNSSITIESTNGDNNVPPLESNQGIPHGERHAPLNTTRGHKSIINSLVYTQVVTFEDDDFTCKAAANVKDATELIEAGWEYVCHVEKAKLFRKRK